MTTAIIGTGGIGSAIARQLALGGEALQLSSVDKQSAQTLAAAIGGPAGVRSDRDHRHWRDRIGHRPPARSRRRGPAALERRQAVGPNAGRRDRRARGRQIGPRSSAVEGSDRPSPPSSLSAARPCSSRASTSSRPKRWPPRSADPRSSDRTAIIGSGGIGPALAPQLALGGEALQLSSVDKQSAQTLAAAIGGPAVV